MTPPGYNEADTRAKLIDPALHARQWIELVKEADHSEADAQRAVEFAMAKLRALL